MMKFLTFIEALFILLMSHVKAFAPIVVSSKSPRSQNIQLAIATSPTREVVQASDHSDHSVQVCLEKLEKRVRHGRGALSSSEVSDLEASLANLMEELLQKQPSPLQQRTQTPEEDLQLRSAVSQMNATQVSALLGAGLRIDEQTTEAAFWEVVNEVNRAEAQNEPLSGDVPTLLHHIFEADMQHLLSRAKISTNITCRQPDDSGGTT